MKNNQVVAFILAGGKGTRLEGLTKKNAKPAVFYGGKYRIIDFVMSNLANSGISSVGLVTQYESIELINYASSGQNWGFDGINSELAILSPRQKADGQAWYNGTANAVYQNLDYLEEREPEYVLILSADHIYKMNYQKLIDFHIKNNADVTICTIPVSSSESSRFGMVAFDQNRKLEKFEEKPRKTTSTEASMGVYLFNYKTLRDVLLKDNKNEQSSHDFGKDVLPHLLRTNKKMYCFPFNGYWKDVGTVESLWNANMDLIKDETSFSLFNDEASFRIMSEDTRSLPQYIGPQARVTSSIINQGSIIFGQVHNSVVFSGTIIEEGCIIEDSVIMPNCTIKKGAKIYKSIIASNVTIQENREINLEQNKVVLINK